MSNIGGGSSLGTTGTGIKQIHGATKDGGGVALSTGKFPGYLTIPYGASITAWHIGVDVGTCTIKVWKVATGTAVPTSGDSINTSGVSISSGTYVRSTTLTDFTTTTITENDILAFNIEAIAGGCTQVTFTLELTRA